MHGVKDTMHAAWGTTKSSSSAGVELTRMYYVGKNKSGNGTPRAVSSCPSSGGLTRVGERGGNLGHILKIEPACAFELARDREKKGRVSGCALNESRLRTVSRLRVEKKGRERGRGG